MVDARCKVLITADSAFRGEKFLHIQTIIDEAVAICSRNNFALKSIILVRRFDTSINRNKAAYESVMQAYKSPLADDGLYSYWDDIVKTDGSDDECEPEWLDSEHPLFILYTSGSTGKPKGVVHTTGGYMLTTALVFKHAFNYVDGDIFFCTADLGWITGHTANVYGALANGATSILFEGIPNYPKPDRLWSIIDHYRVNTFYTAPTAIRSLMKYDEKYVSAYPMEELKLLALVGEPINREAWFWMFRTIGKERCPIVDTYFQTETVSSKSFLSTNIPHCYVVSLIVQLCLQGAPMIFPLPGPVDLKPGSATLPFYGILPVILNENGKEMQGTDSGFLAFKVSK